MNIERTVREEFNSLSKEIFGVSSKWQRFLKGVQELVTKQVTETVPGENGAPDTTKEVTVAVLTENGSKQYRTKFYSEDEIRELLLSYKAQRDAVIAQMKEAEAIKNLEKTIQERAGGKTA